MKKVFIVGHVSYDFVRMYEERGFAITDDISEADLVQFTGGADVDPELYNEAAHPRTFTHPERDEEEADVFSLCVLKGIPMTGICRGGQFLNVMSGGRLYQDVRGHGLNGHHQCIDLTSGKSFMVTSTHHQMMRLGEGGILLAAIDGVAKNKQYMTPDGDLCENVEDRIDVEAVFYPDTKCLCFQPHPEYEYAHKECTDVYFNYINQYLLRD